MKNLRLCLIFAIFSGMAMPVYAAAPWSLEFRANGANSLGDFGDSELHPGFGFEPTVAYYFMEHLAVYGGWGWQHFSTESALYGQQFDVEETGYRFGLQFRHPLFDTRLSYLVSLGGLYSHLELESDDNDTSFDSGHGFGGEIGAGLVIPINDSLSFMPGVRYHYLSRSLKMDGRDRDLELSYLSYGASMSWSF